MGEVAEDAERRAEREHEEEGPATPEEDAPGAAPDPTSETPDVVEGAAVEVDEHGAPVGETDDEVGRMLELRDRPTQVASTLPSPEEFNAAIAIAERISRTAIVPEAYRGRPDDVIAALLFAREIGLQPISALRDIYVIEGKPSLAAHRQMGLLRAGGVVVLESSSTAERAWIRAQRKDTGEIMEIEFTMEEAAKITGKGGRMLVDKDNWRNYPADMLWARAVGRLSRRLGPDLMNGAPPYVAEEVADFSGWGVAYGEGGEVGLSAPPPPSRQERAGRVETPKTWAEIYEWAKPYGEEIGWKVWVADCAERLFDVIDATQLTAQQKVILGQKASGAIVALRDSVDPAALPPPSRADIQRAWAKVLDGQILPGPLWRLSPDEEAVPTFAEFHGLPEPEPPASVAPEPAAAEAPAEQTATPAAGLTPEEQAEADAIPFGSDHDSPYP